MDTYVTPWCIHTYIHICTFFQLLKMFNINTPFFVYFFVENDKILSFRRGWFHPLHPISDLRYFRHHQSQRQAGPRQQIKRTRMIHQYKFSFLYDRNSRTICQPNTKKNSMMQIYKSNIIGRYSNFHRRS